MVKHWICNPEFPVRSWVWPQWVSEWIKYDAHRKRLSAVRNIHIGLTQNLRVTHKWWCASLPSWNRVGSIPMTRSLYCLIA